MTNILHLWSSFSLMFLLLLVPSYSLNLDGTLLLSFKYSILSDPLSVLDNWDYNDANPCSWTGVICAQLENTPRVISLILPNSKLIGTIPEYLGFIQHLKTLDLSNNFLNGTLPTSLFNASELELLSLSNNEISGEIPLFVYGPKNLKLLNLSNNALTGKIPKSLTSLQNLTVLSLRSNSFSGQVPIGIQSLQTLDLSSNLLNGSLPIEFGGNNLKYLNLSSNKLSGSVAQEFATKIPKTAIIDLSFNDLSGEIPDSEPFSNQKSEFFFGNADLCGKLIKKLCTIPSTFSAHPSILANSSSPAIAAIPKPIDSEPSTDDSRTAQNESQITTKRGVKPGAVAVISVGSLAGIGVLAAIALFIYQKKKKEKFATKESMANAYVFRKDSDKSMVIETKKVQTWHCLNITNVEETSEATNSDTDESNNYVNINQHQQVENHEEKKKERLLLMVDGETELETDTLFKASAYVLGSSSASIVYKAVLQNGTCFAVRRIGESGVQKLKEFENLAKAIHKIRHQNLVGLKGFYWGDDEKLVIYDYISNGSLATIGYRKTASSPYHMSFETRLKIVQGVARGLNYLHEKKYVHGNIKPSNILFTIDMEPIISDFGLQWLIYGKNICKNDGPIRHFGSKRSTSCNNDVTDEPPVFQGSPYIAPAGYVGCTSPYHAPESLNNLKPNPKWDVYSFGILLLELLTGKVFSTEWELRQWTASLNIEDRNGVLRMADVAIRRDVAGREESILAWFKLGFSCASLNPQKRPLMKDAIRILEKIPCSSY